jgi:thioredoxin-like negative regulator of GroEL
MANEDAKEKFKRAQELCASGSFQQAWVILEELHSTLPESRRLTTQRVHCLIGLKRFDDAENEAARLQGKVEAAEVQALFDVVYNARQGAGVTPAAPTLGDTFDAPSPAAAPAAAPVKATPPASENANVFHVEQAFPASVNETTVTGSVLAGAFFQGDYVNLTTPEGVPLLAPIVRIGNQETPLQVARQGQRTNILLRVEPQYVVPGSNVTSSSRGESYAETIMVQTGAGSGGAKGAPSAAPIEADSTLTQLDKMLDAKRWEEAAPRIDEYIAANQHNMAAFRLKARLHLEAEGSQYLNPAAGLDNIKKAFELGGDKDPRVLDTLAHALGATGQAEHGLRFLEQLYKATTEPSARQALAKRIHSFRAKFGLGTFWQFLNGFGDVIFESTDLEQIQKAISNGTIPRNAHCKKNGVGDLLPLDEGFYRDNPDLKGGGKKGGGASGGGFFAKILAMFGLGGK